MSQESHVYTNSKLLLATAHAMQVIISACIYTNFSNNLYTSSVQGDTVDMQAAIMCIIIIHGVANR